MVSLHSDAGYVIQKRLELELGPKKAPESGHKSSSSNASGVSLTDNTPRNPDLNKPPVDPDAW